MYIFSIPAPCLKAFALTGRGDFTMREPQGVASLALGYVFHWAFSPPLLNPKLEFYKRCKMRKWRLEPSLYYKNFICGVSYILHKHDATHWLSTLYLV